MVRQKEFESSALALYYIQKQSDPRQFFNQKAQIPIYLATGCAMQV